MIAMALQIIVFSAPKGSFFGAENVDFGAESHHFTHSTKTGNGSKTLDLINTRF